MTEPSFIMASAGEQELLLEFMQEFYLLEHLTYNRTVAQRCLQELFRNPSLGQIYFIHIEEKPVSYIVIAFGFSLEFHGRDALVDELYIREHYRGKGIGTETLEFVQNVCRQESIHALHLEVDRGNISAQQLYRKSGFKDHDRYLLTKRLD